jgi:hypothetical protein
MAEFSRQAGMSIKPQIEEDEEVPSEISTVYSA